MKKILITKKEIKDIKNQYTETLKIVTENFFSDNAKAVALAGNMCPPVPPVTIIIRFFLVIKLN